MKSKQPPGEHGLVFLVCDVLWGFSWLGEPAALESTQLERLVCYPCALSSIETMPQIYRRIQNCSRSGYNQEI